MSEKKEGKEGKERKNEYIARDQREKLFEKMMVVAKPAGFEPPTPQPEKSKGKQESKKE